MKFQMRQDPGSGQFSFQLLSADDQLLLSSVNFADREECTEAIRTAIDRLDESDRFETLTAGNETVVVLSDSDGRELARSAGFASADAANDAINSWVDTAAGIEDYEVTFSRTAAEPTFPFQRTVQIPIEDMYDFNRLSTSGRSGFELYQNDDSKLYFFHYNDSDGQAFLYSRGFKTVSQRKSRIASVIKNAALEGRYERVEEGGQHYFILKARNGQEIARSRMFSSLSALNASIDYIRGDAPGYAEEYVKPKRKKSVGDKNQYNFVRASMSGAAGFEAFRHDDKQWYFHFNDDDGNAILYGQGYGSEKNRDNGIRSVIRNSGNPARYQIKEEGGQFYFILRAGNRQEIARSRMFANQEDAERWILYLQRSVPGAAALYGVTLQPRASEESETFTLHIDRPEGDDDDTALLGAAAIGGAGMIGGDGDDETVEVPRDDTTEEITLIEPPADDTADDITATSPPAAEEDDTTVGGFVPADDVTERTPPPVASTPPPSDSDERSGCMRWLPWILALLFILLLLWLLTRGCSDTDPANRTKSDTEMTTPGSGDLMSGESETDEDMSDAAGGSQEKPAEPEPEPEPPKPLGPDGAALGFAPGSMLAKMADWLSDPSASLPKTFVMDKVTFGRNSSRLKQPAFAEIDGLVRLMKAYPNLKLAFYGHRDALENPNYIDPDDQGRISLSDIRARCLYRKVAERGISTSRLSMKGFGADQPLVDNNSAGNRVKNRRIEIEVTAR